MDDDAVAEGMRRASPAQELRELPVEMIEPNLSQPRRYLDEETLQELAGSIGERGVLQPVLVRPLKDGLTHRQIGERVGRHMAVVSDRIRLLGLSEDILDLVERGELQLFRGGSVRRICLQCSSQIVLRA